MEDRKLIFRDIAMLDMRHAAREGRRLPDRIEDVALMVCNESTDLSNTELKDVAKVLMVPDSAEFKCANGEAVIAASDGEADMVYLLVNGSCVIQSDVTADMLRRRYAGILVNGEMHCARSHVGALGDRLSVNGAMKVYPDGAILRMNDVFRLDEQTVSSYEPGLYAVRRVIALDTGIARMACERGLRFFTGEAVCVHAARGLLNSLLFECSPRITEVPDGFDYEDDLHFINRIKARRLRGRLFVDGDVELDAELSADELKLEALHATGQLKLTHAQFDGLGDMDVDCGSLRLREPGDIEIDGDYALDAAALDALDGRREMWVSGDLTLDEDVTAELIRGRFSHINVSGDVRAPRALWAVGASLGDVSGECAPRPEPEPEAAPDAEDDAEPRDPNAIYVEDVAYYEY